MIKKNQQGKAAFNKRNPHTTQQQEPVLRDLKEIEGMCVNQTYIILNFYKLT
jgi:hypothetical protein